MINHIKILQRKKMKWLKTEFPAGANKYNLHLYRYIRSLLNEKILSFQHEDILRISPKKINYESLMENLMMVIEREISIEIDETIEEVLKLEELIVPISTVVRSEDNV
jgi:hypothetical protein